MKSPERYTAHRQDLARKVHDAGVKHPNVLQAIVFGLMHMSNVVASEQQLKKTMLQTLSATIGGLIAGWSYMYTNSLLTPIMSHMINNIISTGLDSIEYTMYYTKNSA